jgi:hypothetical protein
LLKVALIVVPLARLAQFSPALMDALFDALPEAEALFWLSESWSARWPLMFALSEALAEPLDSTRAPLWLAETDVWLDPESDVCELAAVWAEALQVKTVDASATIRNFVLMSHLQHSGKVVFTAYRGYIRSGANSF